MKKNDFRLLIYNKKENMENNTTLKKEYNKCLENIIQASDYIARMTEIEDIDRIDLYRSFLNQMIDRAIQLRKLLN